MGLAGIWAGLAVTKIRRQLEPPRFESRQTCRAVGEAIGHSTRAVYVSRFYGRPLEYFGELSGVPWRRAIADFQSADTVPASVDERIRSLTFEPEHFVVTDFWRFDRYHGDLEAWLEKRCTLTADEPTFRIWSDCALH